MSIQIPKLNLLPNDEASFIDNQISVDYHQESDEESSIGWGLSSETQSEKLNQVEKNTTSLSEISQISKKQELEEKLENSDREISLGSDEKNIMLLEQFNSNYEKLYQNYGEEKPDNLFKFTVCILDLFLVEVPNHWSIFPIKGVYNMLDGTITFYQTHITCNKPRDHEILKKRHYFCEAGERRGQPYTIFDLFLNNILYLKCSNEEKSKLLGTNNFQYDKFSRFRITWSDEEKRQVVMRKHLEVKAESCLHSGIISELQYRRLAFRLEGKIFLKQVQAKYLDVLVAKLKPIDAFFNMMIELRLEYRKFRVQTYINLPITARRGLENMHVQLPIQKMLETMTSYGFYIEKTELDNIILPYWFDVVKAETLPSVNNFAALIFGEMPEANRTLIAEAFKKISKKYACTVNINDLKQFYSLPQKYSQNLYPFLHCRQGLTRLFQNGIKLIGPYERSMGQNQVDFNTFRYYYQGLSYLMRFESDNTSESCLLREILTNFQYATRDFAEIMTKSWNLTSRDHEFCKI